MYKILGIEKYVFQNDCVIVAKVMHVENRVMLDVNISNFVCVNVEDVRKRVSVILGSMDVLVSKCVTKLP